jgi:hypothetical protein
MGAESGGDAVGEGEERYGGTWYRRRAGPGLGI